MNRLILSPRLPLVAVVMAIIALAVSLIAVFIVLTNIQAQNAKIRNDFCGFVQPIGAAGSPPNPPPATKTGASIVDGAKNTSNALGCTADTNDNK